MNKVDEFTKDDLVRIREVLYKTSEFVYMDPKTRCTYCTYGDLINKINRMISTITHNETKKQDINKDISVYRDKLNNLSVQIIGTDLEFNKEQIIAGRVQEINKVDLEDTITNNIVIQVSESIHKDIMVNSIEIKDVGNNNIIIKHIFKTPRNYFCISFLGTISFNQTIKKEV